MGGYGESTSPAREVRHSRKQAFDVVIADGRAAGA